jgi:hypothetical protein
MLGERGQVDYRTQGVFSGLIQHRERLPFPIASGDPSKPSRVIFSPGSVIVSKFFHKWS